MISIGIDVHKKRCVATIKQNSRKKLEQSSFDNTTTGITDFVKHVKKAYGNNNIRAVCESTANYWMRRGNNKERFCMVAQCNGRRGCKHHDSI